MQPRDEDDNIVDMATLGVTNEDDHAEVIADLPRRFAAVQHVIDLFKQA